MSNTSRPISNVILYNEAGTEINAVKNTYSASAIFGAASNPTDVFTITGSNSAIVRVTKIYFTGTQSTGAMRDVLVINRSSVNTGGTSATPNKVPHDSTFSAATAVVRNYTANPSALGASVGTVYSHKVFIGGTAVVAGQLIIDWGQNKSQGLVLRGNSQVLAINLNGVTSSGNSLSISIEWTEE
jgi:hypothetical protein